MFIYISNALERGSIFSMRWLSVLRSKLEGGISRSSTTGGFWELAERESKRNGRNADSGAQDGCLWQNIKCGTFSAQFPPHTPRPQQCCSAGPRTIPWPLLLPFSHTNTYFSHVPSPSHARVFALCQGRKVNRQVF